MKESSTLLGYVLNTYVDSLCLLARVLALQSREKEAVNLIVSSYVSTSKHPDLYLNLVLISLYLRLARADPASSYASLASQLLSKAIQRNPSNVYLASAAGALLQQAGKPQAALHVFKKVRESALSLQRTCLNIAALFLRESRFSDAASLYESVLSQPCDCELDVRLCLALARMRSGNFPGAFDQLARAVQRDPSVPRLVLRFTDRTSACGSIWRCATWRARAA